MFAKVGNLAPDFSAEALIGDEVKKISLSDYRGKWLILIFYPLDFSRVCPSEITALDMSYDKFKELNAEVLSISVDSVHSHRAWKKEIGGVKFPMISDLTREISHRYNVIVPEKGFALRATFIIDPEGRVRVATIQAPSIGRNTEEILRLIQACQTDELCPADWKPGQRTLGTIA